MEMRSWLAALLGLASAPCVYYWAINNVTAKQRPPASVRLGARKAFGVVEALNEASSRFRRLEVEDADGQLSRSRYFGETGHGDGHHGGGGVHAHASLYSGCAAETNDHWNYEHPTCWGQHFEACKGVHQSPVNIDEHHILTSSRTQSLFGLLTYKPLTGLMVKNHGHGLQVDGDFGEFDFEGIKYDAKQFHVNFPSEHAVNGMLAAGEMQIVHQKRGASGTDSLLIISILFDLGVESELLNRLGLEGSAPSEGTSQAVGGGPLNLAAEIEAELKGGYYRYDGSLTTPPCSETVKWFVLEKRKTVMPLQVHFFKNLYPDPANNRPLQTLNNRAVGKNSLEIDSCGALHGHGEHGHSSDHNPYLYPQCWHVQHDGEACDGKKQSPINIVSADVTSAASEKLGSAFSYRPKDSLSVKNNGHDLEVQGLFGTLAVSGRMYRVLGFHVHFPSEHAIDGKLAAGELQIVHQLAGTTGETDNLLIVSVLIDKGGESALLRKMGLPGSPPQNGQTRTVDGSIDLLKALGDAPNGGFWRYDGSLTTPPCSETVKWFVLETRITASPDQVEAFHSIFHAPGNNRPLQLLHGRSVVKSKFEPDVPGVDDRCAPVFENWGYIYPTCWAEEYEHCDGSEQSPINIDSTKVAANSNGDKLADHVKYKSASNMVVQNNGHAIKVIGDFGTMEVHGHTYKAIHFTAHFPSEHAINGKLLAAEIQITHQKEGSVGNNDLLIVSVLFELGGESVLMGSLGMPSALPAAMQSLTASRAIDLSSDVAAAFAGSYWRYDGSLTKPPCTESVKWFVAQIPMKVSPDQVASFKSIFAHPANNRPIQLLNGRTVVENTMEMSGCDLVAQSAHHRRLSTSSHDYDYLYPQCWSHHEHQCGGQHQSPISINTATLSSEGMQMLHGVLHYKSLSSFTVANDGHNLQVTADFGKFVLDDLTYKAMSIHVHFPSEHAIDGKLHAGELQIVHQLEGAEGNDDLVIIAVFFDVGAESGLLKKLGLPLFSKGGDTSLSKGQTKVVEESFDLKTELGDALKSSYFRYDGSLTAPPCSETVKWFVLETPVTATRAQIQAFKGLFPNPRNNRPLQLLNGRHVVENKHKVPGRLENIHANFRDTDEYTTNAPYGDWAVIIGMLGTAGILFALILATWSVREKKARRPAMAEQGPRGQE